MNPGVWVLVVSLCTGCGSSTVEMNNRSACVLAADNFSARKTIVAYCVHPMSGDIYEPLRAWERMEGSPRPR